MVSSCVHALRAFIRGVSNCLRTLVTRPALPRLSVAHRCVKTETPTLAGPWAKLELHTDIPKHLVAQVRLLRCGVRRMLK